MIETYATSDTCPDCEAVVYDVGRYELRFCPLHAAAPEMLEALKFLCTIWDEDRVSQIFQREAKWFEPEHEIALRATMNGKTAIALATEPD